MAIHTAVNYTKSLFCFVAPFHCTWIQLFYFNGISRYLWIIGFIDSYVLLCFQNYVARKNLHQIAFLLKWEQIITASAICNFVNILEDTKNIMIVQMKIHYFIAIHKY